MKFPGPGAEPDDARFDALLGTWIVDTRVPPRFAEGVWRRLADRPSDSVRALACEMADWLAQRLRQRRVAWAYLLVLLFVGAGAGAWQGREGSAAIEKGLRGRYISSIDPYAGGRP